MAMKITRCTMHSGQGSLCSTYCRNRPKPIRPLANRTPARYSQRLEMFCQSLHIFMRSSITTSLETAFTPASKALLLKPVHSRKFLVGLVATASRLLTNNLRLLHETTRHIRRLPIQTHENDSRIANFSMRQGE